LSNHITFEEKLHCCNFKLLEKAVSVYDENSELVKQRIVAYPKVFSEKENNEFFDAIRQTAKDKQKRNWWFFWHIN
jgi:hypothetical protein